MTGMDEIKAELRRYIEENFLLAASDRRLGDTDSFLEEHILDSTGFLELITHLEETYDIKVGNDELVPENLDHLDAVAAFVKRKRG